MSLRNRLSIRTPPPGDAQAVLTDIKRAIEAIASDFATRQSLIDAGIAKLLGSGALAPGDAIGQSGDGAAVVTYGTPPAPTGVTATALYSYIMVQFQGPTYPGHGYAEILRSLTNVYADAKVIGQTAYGPYIDTVGSGSPVYHYWVRFVNAATEPLTGPPNSQISTTAQTPADVARLLDLLAGQITESELAASLAGRINLIDAPSTGLQAQISSEASARSSADSALASSISTVAASAASNAAAISTEATARANETGQLFARYTVKVDVAGHVSGYGLASTANDGAVVSQFGVRADQFFVAPPSISSATAPTTNLYKGMVWRDTTTGTTKYYTGSAWSTTPQALPLVVQTAPTTINGESVPPGVYIDNAYMARLVATRGQIGLLAVDDARIASLSVGKLVAGSIAVGEYVQSTGYVAGSSGWRISGNGVAEFSGVVVRGTVFASQGEIGGWTIGSNYLQSTTYVLGTSGTRFNSDGTGQIGGVTIAADGLGAGSTGYNIGNGIWLGRDGRLSLRNVSGSIVTFDGSSFKAQNADASRLLDLGATGASPVLKVGTKLVVNADGTATFGGLLTADAINAVNTINIAGQAVTIPVGAYTNGNVLPGGYNNNISIQTLSYTSSGAPVIVSFGVEFSFIRAEGFDSNTYINL